MCVCACALLPLAQWWPSQAHSQWGAKGTSLIKMLLTPEHLVCAYCIQGVFMYNSLAGVKGKQLWILSGRTDAETEAPIRWPPNVKSQLIGKHSDAGKDWWQEEKGATQDEMIGWHHWLNGHEFGHTPGDSEGQGSLACCSPWGCKESITTKRLNNNNNKGQKTRSYLYPDHSGPEARALFGVPCLVEGVDH